MKSIFLIALFCFPVLSLASENCTTDTSAETVEDQLVISTDVPSHLKGAVIIVRTADGRESSAPAEKFKVVPRTQQFIVNKTKQTSQTTCHADKDKNRLNLLVGNGPRPGLDTDRTPNKVTVENRSGAVGGVQYQRLISDKWNVGIQVQTNESALINLGRDFSF